tara:strand:+ start:1079 stop:1261 length:183 start_codon:yes stop_codon:yes gene_type:complete
MKDLWVSDEGTYGTSNVVLVDTTNWSAEDWQELEESKDWDRLQTAVDISERTEGSSYENA